MTLAAASAMSFVVDSAKAADKMVEDTNPPEAAIAVPTTLSDVVVPRARVAVALADGLLPSTVHADADAEYFQEQQQRPFHVLSADLPTSPTHQLPVAHAADLAPWSMLRWPLVRVAELQAAWHELLVQYAHVRVATHLLGASESRP